MATLIRTRKRFSSSLSAEAEAEAEAAPPPSPIPTGKGLRSAADPIFSEYVEKSAFIPELTLPESVHRWGPADIDYPSVASGQPDSLKRLSKSAAQFGVFRVSGHGIPTEELRSTLLSSILAQPPHSIIIGPNNHNGNNSNDLTKTNHGHRQEFVWTSSSSSSSSSSNGALAAAAGQPWQQLSIDDDGTYLTFRQKMDSAARKLESVAELLAQVLAEGENRQISEENITNKPILSIYRYDHHSRIMDQEPPISTNIRVQGSCECVLSLHLMVERCEFYVETTEGRRFSFNTSPGTIVATVGTQLERWSRGRFKHAYGEVVFRQNLINSPASFSLELKYSPSDLTFHSPANVYKKISIADQILVVLIVIFLYRVLFRYIF